MQYSFTTLLFLMLFGTSISAQQLVPPSAIGGDANMRRFVQQEMQYPRTALRNKTEGTVVLLFVVGKDGSASKMSVWQSVSKELDAETIRLFNKIKWKPSHYNKASVSSEHYFRVEYSLKKYNRICKKRGYIDLPYQELPSDSSTTLYPIEALDASPLMLFSDSNYSFEQFLKENLQYPQSAFRANMEGTVILNFVLEPSGVISNLYIKRQLGGGCSNEAMRLLRLIKWYPGLHNGKRVRTELEFVVHFRLPDSDVPRNHGTN